MKKNVILLLAISLLASTMSYASKAENNITNSLDALEAKYEQLVEMEAQRKNALINEKGQLEVEVEELKEKLVGREEKEEKLKKDSEVRWHRDDYKKVLNNYNKYYDNINKLISQKVSRIEEITTILSVMN